LAQKAQEGLRVLTPDYTNQDGVLTA